MVNFDPNPVYLGESVRVTIHPKANFDLIEGETFIVLKWSHMGFPAQSTILPQAVTVLDSKYAEFEMPMHGIRIDSYEAVVAVRGRTLAMNEFLTVHPGQRPSGSIGVAASSKITVPAHLSKVMPNTIRGNIQIVFARPTILTPLKSLIVNMAVRLNLTSLFPSVIKLGAGGGVLLAPGGENAPKRGGEKQPAEFSVDISLDDPDILIPVGIQRPANPMTGSAPTPENWRDSKVKFEIEIQANDDFVADKTTIEVLKHGKAFFTETHEDPDKRFRASGTHEWEWDGFGDDNRLDTRRLLPSRLSVKVTVEKDGQSAEDELELDNEPEKVPWVDVVGNEDAHTVQITVYINFQNGGMPTHVFGKLVGLAKKGIAKYWSRSVFFKNQLYRVTTTAVQRSTVSVPFDLEMERGRNYSRSHNTGIIDGTIAYNEGYFAAIGARAEADDDFRLTAAHEFGHSVLEGTPDTGLSWSHKGTSTKLTQQPDVGATRYPMHGEIDLMKYYNDLGPGPGVTRGHPTDIYTRTIVAEEDIRKLIWLSQVDFDED